MIAQIDKPIDRIFVIGRELTTGSSPWSMVLLFTGIAGFFILLYLLLRLQNKCRQKYYDNPTKLFKEIQVKLNLSVRHRDIVRRIARDLKMDNPTMMFLTPDIFSTLGEKWLLRNPGIREKVQPDLLAIQQHLFPGTSPVS